MDRIVLVVPADPRSLTKLVNRLSGETFTWAYLGPSVVEFRKAKNRLNEQGTYLDTTSDFHRVANELREPYLNYLYRIGKELDSLRWWITGLSYRSSYTSKAFRLACNLKVALSLVEDWTGPGNLVLVLPDKPARAAVIQNLSHPQQKKVYVIDGRYRQIFRPILAIAGMLFHRAYFIWRETYRLVQARRLAPRLLASEKPTTLIVSYATRGNTKPNMDFHESFFGDLATRLDRVGYSVVVVPMILSEVKYLKALHDLRDNSVPLLVPHRYLHLMDIIWAALSTFIQPPRPRPIPRLCGLDIASLIEEELRDYRVSNWAADVSLVVASTKRLSQSQFNVERVIYIFENQPWERALCWASRIYLPETELVAYQHSRVPKVALNYYLASDGEDEAPLPDRIVTVGKHTARLLSDNGHSPEKIRVGGAIQLQRMFELRKRPNEPASVKSAVGVLVAPSNGLEEATELLDLALNLFDEDDGIKVTLKFHPLMPFENVRGSLGDQLPLHVRVSDEPINELMLRASVMVYSGSTVCLEALALGLPIVHVRPRFDFDLDPLDMVPESRPEVEGLEQLREKVRWILDNREEYIVEHQVDWDRLVGDMYGPVNEETIHAFVG